jgi:hypothetical protein
MGGLGMAEQPLDPQEANEAVEGEQQAAEAKAQEEREAEEEKAEEAEEASQAEDEPYSPVSSMIGSWGYNREEEQLEVEFVNGHTEAYPCTAQQWDSAKEAASPGKFMHENFL